jgi:MFS superfamily sulfate permease-like transporter
VLYRFESNLVFYNADFFKARVQAAIAASKTPVEWVIVDASPVNIVDLTALQKVDELREELAARGIVFAVARAKLSPLRFFQADWATKRREQHGTLTFPTLKSAINAFQNRGKQG